MLMRVIVFCLTFIAMLSPLSVLANPYLACDPMTDEVTQVNVDLNGQLINVIAADIIKQTNAWLLVDLSTITGGNYTAKAQAEYGPWGTSAWSADFLFTKPAIDAPANIRLEIQ